MVRKVIFGIFISILCIFAMSHNASALTSTFNINNYEIVRSDYRLAINCIGNFNAILNSYVCDLPAVSTFKTDLTNIYTNQIASKKGDIIEYYLVFSNSLNYSIDGGIFSFNIYQPQNAAYVQTLSIENVDSTVFLDIYSSYSNNSEFFNLIDGFNIQARNKINKVYKITQRVIEDGNHRFGLAGSSDLPLLTYYNLSEQSSVHANLALFTQYRFIGDEANKEQQEKTQEAVDDSEASGESSQSSVEGTTQSLMSAGASIVSALTSAPATDCNISVNTSGSSRLFTTAIGQLNLCSDVPQGVLTMVQSIVALVFTPIVLYFGYNVITTLYNQFKEYNS